MGAGSRVQALECPEFHPAVLSTLSQHQPSCTGLSFLLVPCLSGSSWLCLSLQDGCFLLFAVLSLPPRPWWASVWGADRVGTVIVAS